MTKQVEHIVLELHHEQGGLFLFLAARGLGPLALEPEGERVEVGLEEVERLLGDAR